MTPIFKKDDSTQVKHYRPVSVLPTVSKVCEKLMHAQIKNYIDGFLSPYLCGYRKGYNTQTALLSLIEKWKETLDKKGYNGAVLMDLSKAFDTINHQLLIAKLHAYGFSKSSLKLLFSYLSDRWQRTKVNLSFSDWEELLQGVPQGSVLGPLLFNIYLNDLFYILKDANVCNFADDTTPYVSDLCLKTVMEKLEEDSEIAITWFECNYMKLNTDKCHLLVSGHKFEEMWMKVGKDCIWESKEVKLLGVTIDSELKFEKHVSNLCLKASRKLRALSRMGKFLSFQKKRILYKSFVESQFKYCPLLWMFHSRSCNTKVNRLHERALRLVYDDFKSTFEELLVRDKSFSIHHQNIQTLAIEIYKFLHGLSNGNFKDFFVLKNNRHNIRSKCDLAVPLVNTVLKGKNSLRYFGPVIWNSIPLDIRLLDSFNTFKSKIRQWKPENCHCII